MAKEGSSLCPSPHISSSNAATRCLGQRPGATKTASARRVLWTAQGCRLSQARAAREKRPALGGVDGLERVVHGPARLDLDEGDGVAAADDVDLAAGGAEAPGERAIAL